MPIDPKDPSVGKIHPPLPAGLMGQRRLPHDHAFHDPTDPWCRLTRAAFFEKDGVFYDQEGVEVEVVVTPRLPGRQPL